MAAMTKVKRPTPKKAVEVEEVQVGSIEIVTEVVSADLLPPPPYLSPVEQHARDERRARLATVTTFHPIEEDGHRICALNECAQTFNLERDSKERGVAGSPESRVFCSDECAEKAFYVAEGFSLKKFESQEVRREEVAVERRERIKKLRAEGKMGRGKTETTPEAQEHLTQRYGPIKAVKAVLEERAKSRKVELECGHAITVSKSAKTGRCAVCGGLRTSERKPRQPREKKEPKGPRAPREGKSLADAEAKYGPLRAIKRVVENREKSRKVELECGHVITVASTAKNGRCAKCKGGASEQVVQPVQAKAESKAETKKPRRDRSAHARRSDAPRKRSRAAGKGRGRR